MIACRPVAYLCSVVRCISHVFLHSLGNKSLIQIDGIIKYSPRRLLVFLGLLVVVTRIPHDDECFSLAVLQGAQQRHDFVQKELISVQNSSVRSSFSNSSSEHPSVLGIFVLHLLCVVLESMFERARPCGCCCSSSNCGIRNSPQTGTTVSRKGKI